MNRSTDTSAYWAIWGTTIEQPGEYTVQAYWPNDPDPNDEWLSASNAKYTLYFHEDGALREETLYGNQTLGANQFNTLCKLEHPEGDCPEAQIARFTFGQGATSLILSNPAGYDFSQHQRILFFDAVRWQYTPPLPGVDTVLIIDSSGSMRTNDPQNKRLEASRKFVTYGAVQNDYVGVVDFDTIARVLTNPQLQKLHDNDTNVIAAINTIPSNGSSTNIGLGIQSGCNVLSSSDRYDYKKGAILLTDGIGDFSGEDQCFVTNGWPIYTFGFGSADDILLQDIASRTGGLYKRVDTLISLTCEFNRVRSLIYNGESIPCTPYYVPQNDSIEFVLTIPPEQAQATFSTGWPGSDIVMTLISPSGRVIDRDTVASDVNHEVGPTYEIYTIINPEPGDWQVSLFGADVPAEGEEVIFGFAAVPITPQPPSPPIFSDGFESGNLSAWDAVFTDGGDLSVSAQAAAVGSYGMQAVIDDTTELYIQDALSSTATHYNARFYFDPNSVSIPSPEQSGFGLLQADGINDYWLLCLYVDKQEPYYTLTLCGLDDTDTWLEGAPVYITDDWQALEIEWQAASAPGANDGFIKLWVNDALVDSLENIDNDLQSIAEVYLGVMDLTGGTSGTVYFDAFESRAGSHIGLEPGGPSLSPQPFLPDLIFADGFESGDLSAWSSAVTDGGDLSVSAAAAHQGSYGLSALIDDRKNLRAIHTSPLDETHYRARFYFDPNSLAMGAGKAHYIFEGMDLLAAYSPVLRLELLYESGAYKLRAQGMNDSWGYANSGKYVISDDWHMIELEWQAASAPGATNGIVTGASGSMYFDEFEARRNSYIGP